MHTPRYPAGEQVPVRRIDLSLPPRERYKALAKEYRPKITTITPLFNELLTDMGIADQRYHVYVNTLARYLLRRLYSKEETEELRGISEVTGVDMYLLVALNVVLDLLMGCSSGVVRSNDGTCWHLRTLDWGMDPLRTMVVQLDFVRSEDDPNLVVASSVTYVGFVGVLTGVRQNLSMSLNFRAVHNGTGRMNQLRFYAHHLLVLLGLRPSISSILRQYLMDHRVASLELLKWEMSAKHTTAAYLTFSDGRQGLVLEKDFATAQAREDIDGFLIATNHDIATHNVAKQPTPGAEHAARNAHLEAMQELIEDSEDRAKCVSDKWKRHQQSSARKRQAPGINPSEAVKWVTDWPTTNETTHFAVVMNAATGLVEWARAYHEAVQQ